MTTKDAILTLQEEPKQARGIVVPHGPQIDLSTWQTGIDFEKLIWKEVAGAINGVLAEYPPRIDFPFVWTETDGNGGPGVDSASVFDVGIPLTTDADLYVLIRFDLEHVVDQFIGDYSGDFSDDDAALRRRLAEKLKELSDRIFATMGTKRGEAP